MFNMNKYIINLVWIWIYKDKNKLLRNCVHPKIGKVILDKAMGIYKENNNIQGGLFQ